VYNAGSIFDRFFHVWPLSWKVDDRRLVEVTAQPGDRGIRVSGYNLKTYRMAYVHFTMKFTETV
jgi:hypothetical protein